MKPIAMIKLLFISMLSIICIEASSKESESILFNIQDKIYDSYVEGMRSKTNSGLLKIKTELEELDKNKENNIILYWRAYLQFYESVYYLQIKDKNRAEDAIDIGVELIEDMSNKASEDYALLSRLQSFSLQFAGMKAMFIVKDMVRNSELALELEKDNIRANFVYAANDYYTPKQYGGGKKAEAFLLKTISLPTQKMPNNYLPSWGKEEAYELLIKNYIKKEEKELANKYLKEAIDLYPDSFTIKRLSSKILDK